jgi:hypothetical protein
MKSNRLFLPILASLTITAAACGSDGEGTVNDEADTSVVGKAIYRDSSTDHAGNAWAGSAPPAQDADITIEVRGTGTLDGLEPQCSLEGTSGAFEGVYAGEVSLDDAGLFASLVSSTTATFETPSGCEIPTLTVGAVTEVVVRAELDATTANCNAVWEAHGRAEAEAECGATADAASCRTTAEADAQASCTASCAAETHRIVAETTLSADALARLNASELSGAALGELDIDLVFDRVVDAQGNVVGF